MISTEDFVALCGLTEAELGAIAEHEHIPEVAAAALASYLLRDARGEREIEGMIADDIRAALDRHEVHHAAELVMALRHFVDMHAGKRAPHSNS